MRKRVLSSILGIALAISLTAPAFAAQYSDLEGHWAKSYMEDLAENGYLNGYTDGTMMPDKKITSCETLVLLSRLYTLSDLQSEMIQADYKAVVAATIPSTLSWAYENIELCLASGIITESELKSISLTDNIEKEKLAVFLIRAIQLTSAANNLNNAELSFDDADSISSDCIGSVTELVTLGIVKGDDANNFDPQSSVTRAVVATMVSRSLDYLETKGTTLKIENYEGLSQEEGIIASVSGSDVEICGFDGLTTEYTLVSSSAVTVNDSSKMISSAYEGCYALVRTKNGIAIKLDIDSSSSVVWVQGSVSSVSSAASSSMIYIKNIETGTISSYTVPSTAKITQDGKTATLASVVLNDFVTVKLESSTVTEVCSMSGDHEISGTVSEIKYGTTVTFKITDNNGIEYCFPLDISALPTINRGDVTISIDRLKTGNEVILTIDSCKVNKIDVEGSENTVTGELTSMTTSTNGTVWVIKNSGGTAASYTLDDDVVVYSGTTEIALSDIQVGDEVSVVVYNNVITEINLQSSVASTTKASGTVLKVDTTNSQITILTSSDKLVYISTSYVISIIDANTGYSKYLSAIVVGSELVAYGSYSDSRNFTAKSIIIE